VSHKKHPRNCEISFDTPGRGTQKVETEIESRGPVLRGIEIALHQVRPPSSFRQNLLQNLSLAAQHKITGEPIIESAYPGDQPLLIAILLGLSAVFLTAFFLLLRLRNLGRIKSDRILAASN